MARQTSTNFCDRTFFCIVERYSDLKKHIESLDARPRICNSWSSQINFSSKSNSFCLKVCCSVTFSMSRGQKKNKQKSFSMGDIGQFSNLVSVSIYVDRLTPHLLVMMDRLPLTSRGYCFLRETTYNRFSCLYSGIEFARVS